MDAVLENAKALVSLIGALVTAVLVNNLSGSWEHELTLISVLATAFLTWRIPNQASQKHLPDDPYPEGYGAAMAALDEQDEVPPENGQLS